MSTTKTPGATYDSSAWRRSVAATTEPRLTFDATDREAARRWQQKLRRAVAKRLGGMERDDWPLRARTVATRAMDGYTRETVHFESRRGLPVFGYFLLPTARPAQPLPAQPLPAVLCLHGHGYGVDAIVGLDEHGRPRPRPDYHNDMAIQAVRRGYAVLAIEILGFGRRRAGEFPAGSHAASCQTLSGTALMTGQTMAGWRVYDGMRALDYLEARPEVNRDRLGTMGISGGGLNSLYLAALDQRIKAAVVSGFLSGFQDGLMSIEHCIDNFVPGLALDAEMADIAGLVAPRALWCESGTDDPIFPVASFRGALRRARRIYRVLGVPEKCGGEAFAGGHQFHGVGAFKFLAKHL